MFRLIVLVVASVATVQGACLDGCYLPISHYEEIGCEPVRLMPACCPHYYDCSKFFAQETDKCYFQGNAYNIREEIPTNLTEVNCAASCFCNKGGWQGEEVTCAFIECPENFDPPPPIGEDCFYAYELEGCCSSKTSCPPFDKLATCEVNGKKYYEGQRFDAPGREDKLNCICQPNFEGKFEEPFCKKINCGTELRDTGNFRQKCAPVYYGNRLSCPIYWQCPQAGDKIVPNNSGSFIDQKCYYGEKELNIGDKLILNRSVNGPEINCDCHIPPLVTCIQKPYNN